MIAAQSLHGRRDKSPVDHVVRDYLSYSALQTYRKCPLRYYFRYVLGLQEQNLNANLVFGAAIHAALEYFHQEWLGRNQSVSLEELMALFNASWNERGSAEIQFAKNENREGLQEVAKRLLNAFLISDFSRPRGTILAIEETLRESLVPGVPDLLGKVDLILEQENKLVIRDWKTSRGKWSPLDVANSAEQLILYSELAKGFMQGASVQIEFVVFTKTKDVQVACHTLPVTPASVRRVKASIEQVWRAIAAGYFYPAPDTMHCGSCPFREPCNGWPS